MNRIERIVVAAACSALLAPASARAAGESLAGTVAAVAARSAAAAQAPASVGAVPAVFEGDTRLLPAMQRWAPGMPVRQGPPRRNRPPHVRVSSPQHYPDPFVTSQRMPGRRTARVYEPPELNMDGQVFSGVEPPDPNGDVGSRYYIQLINTAAGTGVAIYDKSTGALASGPFTLATLWVAGGACSDGYGDPIVLYDPLASRWLMAEFASSGNHLCVYVSRSDDPIDGGWLNYDFTTPDFPDYPKFAVWPDAYFVTTNENFPAVYALDRARMLAGLPASMQRFTAPPLSGLGFQALTPVDIDGTTPPPAGSPGFFVRQVDDELSPPAMPGSDSIEVWSLAVDFDTPANSVLALDATIPTADFDSSFCGGSYQCIAQPGGAVGLDPLAEVVMWRAQYRNFAGTQTLVGNFVTDVTGTDRAGVRWFELRRSGLGAWSLHQEGTYSPDGTNRWMASLAMDGSGNMALGYSVSSTVVYPGIRYTGRLAGSPLGAMDQTEVNVVSGAASQTSSERWGDYSSMTVDPVDDCTYWYTNEYMRSNGVWRTRIARFRYPAPTCTSPAAPSCGNDVAEVGEDCDGTDSAYCPGLCTGSCTCPVPTCGNDVVEVGEQCDGASLGSCGNGCTAQCTCLLCGPTPEPAASCFLQAQPGRAAVKISDQIEDKKDSLVWKWNKGEATTLGDLGTATAAGVEYWVCVYDGSGGLQPLRALLVEGGGDCNGKPCWRATSKGYRFRNRDGNADGVNALVLKAGLDGKSQVIVKGKGVALSPPALSLTLPVTVQLLADTGSGVDCWQTEFSVAATNDGKKFKAKGP